MFEILAPRSVTVDLTPELAMAGGQQGACVQQLVKALLLDEAPDREDDRYLIVSLTVSGLEPSQVDAVVDELNGGRCCDHGANVLEVGVAAGHHGSGLTSTAVQGCVWNLIQIASVGGEAEWDVGETMREQSDQRRVVSEVRVDVRHRRGLAPWPEVISDSDRGVEGLESGASRVATEELAVAERERHGGGVPVGRRCREAHMRLRTPPARAVEVSHRRCNIGNLRLD